MLIREARSRVRFRTDGVGREGRGGGHHLSLKDGPSLSASDSAHEICWSVGLLKQEAKVVRRLTFDIFVEAQHSMHNSLTLSVRHLDPSGQHSLLPTRQFSVGQALYVAFDPSGQRSLL